MLKSPQDTNRIGVVSSHRKKGKHFLEGINPWTKLFDRPSNRGVKGTMPNMSACRDDEKGNCIPERWHGNQGDHDILNYIQTMVDDLLRMVGCKTYAMKNIIFIKSRRKRPCWTESTSYGTWPPYHHKTSASSKTYCTEVIPTRKATLQERSFKEIFLRERKAPIKVQRQPRTLNWSVFKTHTYRYKCHD